MRAFLISQQKERFLFDRFEKTEKTKDSKHYQNILEPPASELTQRVFPSPGKSQLAENNLDTHIFCMDVSFYELN